MHEKAQFYIAGNQFFSPKGRNAFELLAQLLEVNPQDAKARASMEELYEREFGRGEVAFADRRPKAALRSLGHAQAAATALGLGDDQRAELDTLFRRCIGPTKSDRQAARARAAQF